MPQLSELIQKKKFVKKEYRPWNLSGEGTVDNNKQETALDIEINTSFPAKATKLPNSTVEKTDNKTGNELGNKQVTTRSQPDNIQITNPKQPGNNQVTFREQRDNIIDNVTGNGEGQVYLIDAIKKLTGIQKNIFYFVINTCSARNALDTGNLLSSDLANITNSTVGSAKTSLIRLLEKHLVLRLQGKACRGGHMILGITKEIQAAAIQAQQTLFNPLKVARTGNIIDNVSDNNRLYSSSNKYITTTALPLDWKKINFTSLEHLGFCETQLQQLHDSKMTEPEIIQDSIDRFAYSLEHNEKTKTYSEPLHVLMGLLRKGKRWIEPNYIAPKELALRQMLEEKRKQKEQREMMIKELIELEFPEWKRKLTDEEIRNIVPAEVLKTNLSVAIQASLRSFFTEKIILPRIDEN